MMSLRFDKLLECAVCNGVVQKPVILSCFHCCCEKCLLTVLMPKTPAEIKGVQCPLCSCITRDFKFQQSYFMNELLNRYICHSCFKHEAKLKCHECNMILCEDCRTNHLRFPLLKNHSIVKKCPYENLPIDSVLFCATHKENPIHFNCRDCQQPICIICKHTRHRRHTTDTIEATLAHMVPKLKKNASKLQGKISAYQSTQDAITVKILEVRSEFEKCEDIVKSNLNQVLDIVRKLHSNVITHLQMKKEDQLSKLEKASGEIEAKKKQCMQAFLWAVTSVDTAKGAPLLFELQTGLRKCITDLLKRERDKPVKVETPLIEINNDHILVNDVLGKLSYKLSKVPSVQSVAKSGKLVPSIPAFFTNSFKQDKLCIELGCYATRMAVINRDLWVPITEYNVIKVYSLANGKFIKDLKNGYTIRPRRVCQAGNGDIVVASDSGLHVIDEAGQLLSILMDGTFCDVCVWDDKMYAINYSTPNVYELTYGGLIWEGTKSLPRTNGMSYNITDTIESNGKYILVTHSNSNHYISIFKNSHYKTCVNYGYKSPLLSFTDEKGNFLIASWCKDVPYNYYNPDTNVNRSMKIPDLRRPVDAVYDSVGNSVWILNIGDRCVVNKYCIQSRSH